MILFNFTGLSGFHWLPSFRGQRDGEFWYVSVKFLGVQAIVHSRAMGTLVLAAFHSTATRWMEDRRRAESEIGGAS